MISGDLAPARLVRLGRAFAVDRAPLGEAQRAHCVCCRIDQLHDEVSVTKKGDAGAGASDVALGPSRRGRDGESQRETTRVGAPTELGIKGDQCSGAPASVHACDARQAVQRQLAKAGSDELVCEKLGWRGSVVLHRVARIGVHVLC